MKLHTLAYKIVAGRHIKIYPCECTDYRHAYIITTGTLAIQRTRWGEPECAPITLYECMLVYECSYSDKQKHSF